MASGTSSFAGVRAVLSVFLVAAASAGPAPSSKYSVEEACKQAAGHHDLCVATLSADPSSKTANTTGLAWVAVEQLSDATSAVDSGAFSESEALVAASQAEVKLCQTGCQAVPDHRNILTARKLIRGPPS
ncbi:cell wall / vacuolar inhibitor of fructosidase 2-like [Panicum miliaceum]|uniref:Cell wall / vacuolar inhibitor of fructosidase 2-like n=1 Tax=Panicum miliaceum TaxID=4540 RepID=A0A3L6SPW3_PANMI|nr:cell wall / vacuolar inhibitor of fructosidase 2-like [Panicum miliaceum]